MYVYVYSFVVALSIFFLQHTRLCLAMAGSGCFKGKGKGKVDDFFVDFERPLSSVEMQQLIRELCVQVRGLKSNITLLETMMNEAYETIASLNTRVESLEDKVRESRWNEVVTFETKTDTEDDAEDDSQLRTDTEDEPEIEAAHPKKKVKTNENDTMADTAERPTDTNAAGSAWVPPHGFSPFQGFSDSEPEEKADVPAPETVTAEADDPGWGSTPRTPLASDAAWPQFPPVGWGENPALGPVEDLFSHLAEDLILLIITTTNTNNNIIIHTIIRMKLQL